MPRNVEIKARARDFEKQSRLAEALAKGAVERMVQEDTFFNVPAGRLKLRVLADGSCELWNDVLLLGFSSHGYFAKTESVR